MSRPRDPPGSSTAERSHLGRCRAQTIYSVYNAVRRTKDGKKRFEHGDACMNPARWRDIDNDLWCTMHAKRNLRQHGDSDSWAPYKDVRTGEVLALAA